MKASTLAVSLCAALAAVPAFADSQSADTPSGKQLARGRYVVQIGGCNDCHTPGYGMSGGSVPESQWLVGDALGWQGPWGTTYPTNLRLYFQRVSEGEWLKTAKTFKTRPPMPWFALHDMTRADLRALYRFVRHLGPAGKPAPAFVPPGGAVSTPVIAFPAPPKQ